MIDRMITLSQCAALMGVSAGKAYRLVRARKAPFEHVEKYGNTYLVPYLAFCERIGLQPDAVDKQQADGGDVLCA